MEYTWRAWTKAMTAQELIEKAMRGEIKWFEAAARMGVSARQLRRIKAAYDAAKGAQSLLDKRQQVPSPKRATMAEVALLRDLYREKYMGFNVAHFHEIAEAEHGLKRSYTWVKRALQEGGLVALEPKRGKHRLRRERRPLAGMMLHIDGSTHAWYGPGHPKMDLLGVMDDATSEMYSLHLVDQESTLTCMTIIRDVIEKKGLFAELYADRGSHFWYTPKAGEGPSTTVVTQLGRALATCSIRLIAAMSPQARGRGERMWATIQGRLPNELRVAGITTQAEAQKYINEKFLPSLNRLVMVAATDSEYDAFTDAKHLPLAKIFCEHHARSVGKDNCVVYEKRNLQLVASKLRYTFAGQKVTVREAPSGELAVYYGEHLLGRYDAEGKLLEQPPHALNRPANKQAA